MTTGYEWTGRVGEAWAELWRDTDRSFAALEPALETAILAAAPNEGRAVDLGCGAGTTSLAVAAARPGLSVTGVDVSAALIAAANARVASENNVNFILADVEQDAAELVRDADLLFSRHGVMFYADPAATFTALARGARSGARLVFSCFRSPALNPWASALVAEVSGVSIAPPAGYTPGPFGFADPSFTSAMLSGAGWDDVTLEAVDYTYLAGEGADAVADAVRFFSRIGPAATALAAAPPEQRDALLDRLASALRPHCHDGRVTFPAAAWIVRARTAAS